MGIDRTTERKLVLGHSQFLWLMTCCLAAWNASDALLPLRFRCHSLLPKLASSTEAMQQCRAFMEALATVADLSLDNTPRRPKALCCKPFLARPVQLAVQRGPVAKVLPMDKSCDHCPRSRVGCGACESVWRLALDCCAT